MGVRVRLFIPSRGEDGGLVVSKCHVANTKCGQSSLMVKSNITIRIRDQLIVSTVTLAAVGVPELQIQMQCTISCFYICKIPRRKASIAS